MLSTGDAPDSHGMPHRKPFAWSLLFGVCCALASLVQAMDSPVAAGAEPPVSQPSAVASAAAAVTNVAPTVVTQAPPAETTAATLTAVPASPEPATPAPTVPAAAAATTAPAQAQSRGALPSALDAATPPPSRDVSLAKAAALLDLMNGARLEAGLQALHADGELEDVALVRADNLVENGYFDHYSPDGESAFSELAARGIGYRLAGENLARNNFAEAKTVAAAFDALMASAGHRANILEPRFTSVGVAAVLYGKVWLYVTVFKD